MSHTCPLTVQGPWQCPLRPPTLIHTGLCWDPLFTSGNGGLLVAAVSRPFSSPSCGGLVVLLGGPAEASPSLCVVLRELNGCVLGELSLWPPGWLGVVEMELRETVRGWGGDSPSSVSRPNPRDRRIASRHAAHGHRLGTAIATPGSPPGGCGGRVCLTGPKGHKGSGFRGERERRDRAARNPTGIDGQRQEKRVTATDRQTVTGS